MAASVTWTFPAAVIERARTMWSRVEPAISRGVEAAALLLQSKLKTDYLSGDPVHRRSGNLSRSVFVEKTGQFSARVATGAEAPYAIFVEEGTRPHVIFPKSLRGATSDLTDPRAATAAGRKQMMYEFYAHAPALRFETGGEVVFAMVVHHPGTAATHFMQRAVSEQREAMLNKISQQVVKEIGL